MVRSGLGQRRRQRAAAAIRCQAADGRLTTANAADTAAVLLAAEDPGQLAGPMLDLDGPRVRRDAWGPC